MNLPSYIMIYSFRYALGRRTSAPDDVASEIRKHVKEFQKWEIEQMIHEISYEEERNNLGDNCDKHIWVCLKEFLINELKARKDEENNFSTTYHS